MCKFTLSTYKVQYILFIYKNMAGDLYSICLIRTKSGNFEYCKSQLDKIKIMPTLKNAERVSCLLNVEVVFFGSDYLLSRKQYVSVLALLTLMSGFTNELVEVGLV